MCDLCGNKNHTPKHFVHLHGHTKYSVGDSTSDVDKLVAKAKAAGMEALAVTDHGIASSWIQMSKACKKAGIKFIPGVEMYEVDDRTIKNKNEMVEKFGSSKHYHFLMLPKNNEGLRNLNRIISDGSLVGRFGNDNRTDMETIEKNGWGKGIIATSACLASRISRYIQDGRIEDAKQFALWCDQIFDEFYLELQDNHIKDQYIVNEGLKEIANETGLPLVYTQDYHYIEENEQDLHDTWICVGRKNLKNDPSRQGYDGDPLHFATQEEMYKGVEEGRIPQEAFDNTVKIANQCDVEFDLSINRYPKYPFTPKEYTADQWLRKKSFDYLWDYAIEMNEKHKKPINMMQYTTRLDHELNVIAGKGYSDYFLILEDIFGYCFQNNIYVGPGRGSGAGSLTAFVNKITGLDPIEHGLLFERFLNPERMSAPDKRLVA